MDQRVLARHAYNLWVEDRDRTVEDIARLVGASIDEVIDSLMSESNRRNRGRVRSARELGHPVSRSLVSL